MHKVKRVVLAGYYGYSNAGDELILRYIVSGLKERFPHMEISVLHRSPKTARDSCGCFCSDVNYIGRYNIFKLVLHILHSDVVVMGGGSLIQDVSGLFTIYYYLGLICRELVCK